MKDLLQKAFEYGQKFEGRGGDENYSFEQFLTDNNQALQLLQGGVSGSALYKICNNCNKEYKIEFVVGTNSSVCLHQTCQNCNEVDDVWLKLMH